MACETNIIVAREVFYLYSTQHYGFASAPISNGGYRFLFIIDENAALVAYGSSGGSIRKLNLILTKALMIGAQNNKQSIDADMVLSAVNDIELC